MKILKKFILVGIMIMLFSTIFAFGRFNPSTSPQDLSDEKKQELTDLAKNKYQKAKNNGTKFDSGPCLGMIISGWVVDIVHQPRQKADDNPDNQCPDYLNGNAKHFIELDPNGNFIRME